ncbi:hypothetical protein TRFO_04203 [Tritrichomonas foetus]|uniref:Uncharacterized protein n=1 Tax=Tritrichomonas foetus TaxID=1144522 RepID=A0A1J4KLW7_9EUKA|nr:hypothetical protein TRFO_04203 [Tritrichomonas foetus]|eukprot:OHT10686.1 hypothetical protein TRFO_04203 [Tritrichomonas foetus]
MCQIIVPSSSNDKRVNIFQAIPIQIYFRQIFDIDSNCQIFSKKPSLHFIFVFVMSSPQDIPIAQHDIISNPAIRAHSHFQTLLYNLNEQNINGVFNYVIDQNLISENNIFDLIKSFFMCIVGRTNLIPYYIDLLKLLSQSCDIFGSIKTHLPFFLESFLKNPIIMELNNQSILSNLDIENAKSSYIKSYLQSKCQHYSHFQPELQKISVEIRKYIKEDDGSKLQEFFAHNDQINIDMMSFCNDWPTYSLMTSKPNLIQYAAQCGSIQCFKFLLMNHACLNQSVQCSHGMMNNRNLDSLHFAIGGQNLEIIRLVMQQGFELQESHLLVAVELHNIQLFDWIYENISSVTPNMLLQYCLKNFFLYGFKQIEGICWDLLIKWSCFAGFTSLSKVLLDMKPTNNDYLMYIPFSFACVSGDLVIVKQLYNEYSIRVFNPVLNHLRRYPLVDSIMHCNIHIIKYLLTLKPIRDLINYDCTGSFSYIQTPLIEAAKNNQTEIVKLLLEIPEININKHASDRMDNCFPFELIAHNGNMELVDLFLSRPDFTINEVEFKMLINENPGNYETTIDESIRNKITEFYFQQSS